MIVVVLPAYNEEKGIVPLLQRIQLVARTWFFEPVKVVVVDDRSEDSTVDQVLSLRSEVVELVRHEHNRGLGEALRTGILAALKMCQESDVIVTMDADNSHKSWSDSSNGAVD